MTGCGYKMGIIWAFISSKDTPLQTLCVFFYMFLCLCVVFRIGNYFSH